MIVDHDELAVHHGGGVLPDLCAGAGEFEEVGALRDAADLEVGVLATDDDLDVHTALTGAHECVDKMAVGNEVGVFDEDRFARGIDGEEEAGPQGVAPGIRITDAEMGELVACG